MKMKNSKKISMTQQEIQSDVKDSLNLQTLKNEMQQLREREHKLAERLVAEHGLVNELRKNPHFINEADRERLACRISANGGSCSILTEVDIQYCVLIKLRFTIAQIAILSAISPTSVYQQKSRMKKRILSINSHLFANGEPLDAWLHEL